MQLVKKKKFWLILLVCLVVLAAVVYGVFRLVTNSLMESEIRDRDSWEIQTGSYAFTDEELQIDLYTDPVEASITVLQMVPHEYQSEGFTYYDESVQQRLAQSLATMLETREHTIAEPLAVLNPFGTGSNGLYLCFTTEARCQIRYTVHVDDADIPDYTATANNNGKDGYSRVHEFLLIGLVPGETNTVTLEAVGTQGRVRDSFSFTIDMPETTSGYANRLETTDGESAAALSDGLFYAMGLGDYYGYTFFFDNDGVMRYEMVMDGYHADRILNLDGDIVTCVGSTKLARLSRLGQAVRVYDLGQYELHHDINWGPDGTVLAWPPTRRARPWRISSSRSTWRPARSPSWWTSPSCCTITSPPPRPCRPPTPSSGRPASGTGST